MANIVGGIRDLPTFRKMNVKKGGEMG